MAFPWADRQYALIKDAATGTADTAGGLEAILTQKVQFDNFYAMHLANSKTMKIIIRHFYSSLPLLSGAWMYSTNTSKEKNHTLY
jgi:hypothetical protein